MRQSSRQAAAEKAIFDLARLLDNLAPGEGPLRQAADKLSADTQAGAGGWTRSDRIEPGHAGYFVPPTAYTAGLRGVTLALQAKDPGDRARQRPGGAERAGAAPVQEPRRGLLSGSLAGPAMNVWFEPCTRDRQT